MKRDSTQLGILIIVLMYLSLGMKCIAQSQFSDTLTRMEKSLFGIDYGTQSDEIRIKRIEEQVYGAASNGSTPQRINKLSHDMSADLLGQEIKPKSDTFVDADDEITEPMPKADSNVKYPIVDLLEQSVFNKEFKTIEVEKRLARLEQNVFRKTYSDDLNARVERLKHAVMPERVAAQNNSYTDDDEDTYDSESLMDETSQFQDNGYGEKLSQGPTGFGVQIPRVPNYNSNNSVLDEYQDDSDLIVPLAALEKNVLKKNYPDDTVSNRLLRMELKVFNSTFTEDDEQTRLDRIASAYQAKKTSKKYDNNKFVQHSAAAMQIGAILLMIIAAIL